MWESCAMTDINIIELRRQLPAPNNRGDVGDLRGLQAGLAQVVQRVAAMRRRDLPPRS
jgi:hypothetical protein